MQHPCHDPDREADRPPSRPKQGGDAVKRPPKLDRGRGDGTPVLAEQADVGDERAGAGEQYADWTISSARPVPAMGARYSGVVGFIGI